MIVPEFTFDAEANGYLSDSFEIEERATVHIELASRAPVLTLMEDNNGEWANYGQTPEEHDRYEIEINTKDMAAIRLATPVEVTKCYVLH